MSQALWLSREGQAGPVYRFANQAKGLALSRGDRIRIFVLDVLLVGLAGALLGWIKETPLVFLAVGSCFVAVFAFTPLAYVYAVLVDLSQKRLTKRRRQKGDWVFIPERCMVYIDSAFEGVSLTPTPELLASKFDQMTELWVPAFHDMEASKDNANDRNHVERFLLDELAAFAAEAKQSHGESVEARSEQLRKKYPLRSSQQPVADRPMVHKLPKQR